MEHSLNALVRIVFLPWPDGVCLAHLFITLALTVHADGSQASLMLTVQGALTLSLSVQG